MQKYINFEYARTYNCRRVGAGPAPFLRVTGEKLKIARGDEYFCTFAPPKFFR